jgi:hypothetical protein
MDQGQGNSSRANVELARASEQTLGVSALAGRDMSERDHHQRGSLRYSLVTDQAMTSSPQSYPQTSSAGIAILSPDLSHSRRAFEMPGNIHSMANDFPFMNFPELGQFLDENPINFTF